MMKDYEVNMNPEEGCDFTVVFRGPENSMNIHLQIHYTEKKTNKLILI